AFAYMADLANFAEWDPGVESAEQVEGDGPGPGAAFDVGVRTAGRTITLRYHVTAFEPPNTIVARAESRTIVSLDTITIEATDGGSIVTYDADLTLKGLARLLDPFLGLAFNRIGDRAAAGLIDALDGERGSESPA
ncbi:MAG: SRPBCC family protein, partial [Microthrixaceae bacterium]